MKTKTRYTVGWLLWLAAFLALEGSALFNKVDHDTLSEHVWGWLRIFDPDAGPIFIGLRVVVGLFLLWLLGHMTMAWFTPTHPFPHLLTLEIAMAKTWLKRDAVNRAWRTFWQTVVAAGLVAAADAAMQVVASAAAAKASGGVVDWGEVLRAAEYAGAVAAFAPLLSYLHRMKLDPSRLPSAAPPEPPTVNARQRA